MLGALPTGYYIYTIIIVEKKGCDVIYITRPCEAEAGADKLFSIGGLSISQDF